MRRITVLGLMIVLVAACSGDEIDTDNSPLSAAEAFLSLIDKGNYAESWAEASPWLRANVDANEWAEHAGAYRQPLGNISDRELNSIEFQDSLEDMPAGEYAFVVFDTSLADDGSTIEMVGLKRDEESVWRVIGYQTH